MYAVELLKVVVTPVEDIVGSCLIRNFMHGLGIMNRGGDDMVEGRNLCLQVVEDVSLDFAFLLTKLYRRV